MTDPDIAAAMAEHVRAFNDRDIDTLMSGFTEDACWMTGSTTARGREELTDLFTGAMAGLLPTLTVHDLLVNSDRAACQLIERLTVQGEEMTCFIAGFYQFRGDRIASAKIYREGTAEVALTRRRP